MKREERIKMVCAMDYIARHAHGKYSHDLWSNAGVADWEIESGDLEKYYEDDNDFADLMDTFLVVMHNNKLACDGVVSKPLAMEDAVPEEDFNKEVFIELLDAMIKFDKKCSERCNYAPHYNMMLHDRFEGSIGALERVKKLLTDPEYYEGMKSLYL